MGVESKYVAAAPLTLEAWQCIGCGRIEAPRPCIGVCEDRKVQFVYAAEYERALDRVRQAERTLAGLESLVRRLALTKPRAGEWERSYRTLQDDARRALAELSSVRSSRADPLSLRASQPEEP
jgi:hypothetical protein